MRYLAAHHGLNYPQFSNPGLSIGLGPLRLDSIVQVGGTVYVRKRVAQPYLASGRSHVVLHTPEFTLSAYAVYPEDADGGDLAAALARLREVARAEDYPIRNLPLSDKPKAAGTGVNAGTPIPAE
jgi:hypothetical protein